MSRGRIMIVEDESLVAEDLRACLQRSGYDVVGIADTCASAQTLAEVARPDLALLDIRLKGAGDGIELAGELRRREIGYVYLTSHSDESTLARAEVTEPLGYILKPFSSNEMIPVLRTALYRHAAEMRLRNVEQWLRTTITSIGDAVIVTDAATVLTWVNPSAERLLGRPLRDLVGRTFHDVVPIWLPEASAPRECIASYALRSNSTVFLEHYCELALADGRRRPVDDCAAPIRDRDGRVSGVVVVMRDATETRAAERQRQDAERRLREAERMQSLAVMAGGLSHDLNNALSVILGNAALCRDQVPPTARAPFDQIEASARTAARLCRRLLEGAGAAPVELEAVDLLAVMQACVASEQSLASPTLRFVVSPPAAKAMVLADELQLQQVLHNLLRNATEALEGRSGEVRLAWREVTLPAGSPATVAGSSRVAPGPYVCIEVADDGPGVPEAVRASIFEPFFTTKFTGRGLGLASTHGIIRRHGGSIELVPDVATGACFRILWPAAPTSPVRAKGGVVLIVDDDDAVRGIACRMLTQLGWKCHEARSGTEALSLLASGLDVDGVVLDISMPGLPGVETYEQMRRRRPDLPVLFVSGMHTRPDLSNDPLVRFLQKPYSLAALEAAVAPWLAAR